MKRAIVIVLDGCGAGAAPDHLEFDASSETADTLRHACQNGIQAPLLQASGYLASAGLAPAGLEGFQTRFGRLKPLSKGGKDSVTGHWEMMGVVLDQPFPTYPDGFPSDLLDPFVAQFGPVLGNKAASGTAIIAEFGERHMESSQPIIYTSADSVFQIACHEAVVPVEKLYEMCRFARETTPLQRVIARPFVGSPGSFERTDNRRDFPLAPPLNLVDDLGDVYGIGVVPELFGGRGFRPVRRTQNNAEHWIAFDQALASNARFIFANFEDFDMRFGHRNDAPGFAHCLEEFDGELARRLPLLQEGDLLILTADHGNDPTTPSTDHNREFVPFVALTRGAGLESLGDLDGFAVVGEFVRRWLS